MCALANEGIAHRKLGNTQTNFFLFFAKLARLLLKNKCDSQKLYLCVAYISKRGVPVYSICVTAAVSFVTFATSFIPGKGLFVVLTDLSGIAGFTTWGGIAFAHFRFRRAMKRQGHSVDELPIKAPFHPFGDIFGMIACVVISLMAGYSYFVPADPIGLVGNYAGIILCIIGFVCTKLYTKSKMVPLDEIDLVSGRADIDMLMDARQDDITGPWYVRLWKKLLVIFT